MTDRTEFEKRTLVECLVSGNAILAHVQLVPMESGFKYEWWLVSIEPLHCHIRVGADFYKGCCDMNDRYAVCWNEDDTATKPGLLTVFDLKNFKVIINNAYSRALDCAKLLPNNKLVIAFEKGEIEILDLNSKAEVSVTQMSNCYIQTMHLDPWSNQLVLWNADWSTKQLLWLDLETAKIVRQIQVEPEDDELWRRPDFGFIDEKVVITTSDAYLQFYLLEENSLKRLYAVPIHDMHLLLEDHLIQVSGQTMMILKPTHCATSIKNHSDSTHE